MDSSLDFLMEYALCFDAAELALLRGRGLLLVVTNGGDGDGGGAYFGLWLLHDSLIGQTH